MVEFRNSPRDVFKYMVVQGGRNLKGGEIVYWGVTNDLARREAEHQTRFPMSRVEQIGRRTTRKAALTWSRRMDRRYPVPAPLRGSLFRLISMGV